MYGGFKASKLGDEALRSPVGEVVAFQAHRTSNKAEGYNRGFRLYGTISESPDAITPFLALNKAKDEERRNYVILQGGAAYYPEDDYIEGMSPATNIEALLGRRPR